MGGFRKKVTKVPVSKDTLEKNEGAKAKKNQQKQDERAKERDTAGRDSPARRRSLLGIGSVRDLVEQVQDSLSKSRHDGNSGGGRPRGASTSPQRAQQPKSPAAMVPRGRISPPQKKKSLELKLPSGPSLSLRTKKTPFTPSPVSEFKARERQEFTDLPHCSVCAAPFALLVRRQRCQVCGENVCAQCSLDRRHVEGHKGLQRVCDICIVEGPVVFGTSGEEDGCEPCHPVTLRAPSPIPAFTPTPLSSSTSAGTATTRTTPGYAHKKSLSSGNAVYPVVTGLNPRRSTFELGKAGLSEDDDLLVETGTAEFRRGSFPVRGKSSMKGLLDGNSKGMNGAAGGESSITNESSSRLREMETQQEQGLHCSLLLSPSPASAQEGTVADRGGEGLQLDAADGKQALAINPPPVGHSRGRKRGKKARRAEARAERESKIASGQVGGWGSGSWGSGSFGALASLMNIPDMFGTTGCTVGMGGDSGSGSVGSTTGGPTSSGAGKRSAKGGSKWEKSVTSGLGGSELCGYSGFTGFVRGFIRGAGIYRLHPRHLQGFIVKVGAATGLNKPVGWVCVCVSKTMPTRQWWQGFPTLNRRGWALLWFGSVVLLACYRRYQLTHPDFTVEYAFTSTRSAVVGLVLFLMRALTDLLTDMCLAVMPGYCGVTLGGRERSGGAAELGCGDETVNGVGIIVDNSVAGDRGGDVNRFFFL